jgi:hypothetical protein
LAQQAHKKAVHHYLRYSDRNLRMIGIYQQGSQSSRWRGSIFVREGCLCGSDFQIDDTYAIE